MGAGMILFIRIYQYKAFFFCKVLAGKEVLRVWSRDLVSGVVESRAVMISLNPKPPLHPPQPLLQVMLQELLQVFLPCNSLGLCLNPHGNMCWN